MGAANVLAAYNLWPDLPHRAHRLLVYMAVRSLDSDSESGRPPRRAFLNPEEMADAIGVRTGPDARWDSRGRIVRRTIADLEKAGAIRRVVKAAPGRRAEYELVLDPMAQRTETAPRTEDRDSPRTEGCDSPPHEGRNGPPQEYSGTTSQENDQDNISGSVPHQVEADEPNPDDDDELMHARKTLGALSPEAWEAAMLWASSVLPPNSKRTEREIAAARHATEAAA